MTPPNTTNGSAFEAYFKQTLLPAVQSLQRERQRVRRQRRWIALVFLGLATAWGAWLWQTGPVYILFAIVTGGIAILMALKAPSSLDDKYKAALNPLLLKFCFDEVKDYQAARFNAHTPLLKNQLWQNKILHHFERDYFQARSGRVWCEGFQLQLDRHSVLADQTSEAFFEGIVLKFAWPRPFTGQIVLRQRASTVPVPEHFYRIDTNGTDFSNQLLIYSDRYTSAQPLLSSAAVQLMFARLFALDHKLYRIFLIEGFMYVCLICDKSILEYSFNTDYSDIAAFQKMMPSILILPEICAAYDAYLQAQP